MQIYGIGIDKETGVFHELVSGTNAIPYSKPPVITSAKFIQEKNSEAKASGKNECNGYKFREDSFDPTTRIRRGRFYIATPKIEEECYVYPPVESGQPLHRTPRRLYTFQVDSIWHKFIQKKNKLPLVYLGIEERFTVWEIISVEAISTGEDLVTLKGRNSFGILPDLDESKVTSEVYKSLSDSLSTIASEVHTASPSSLIHSIRDIALDLLTTYVSPPNKLDDVAKLANKLNEQQKFVASWASHIIAKLHSRAKSNERKARNFRPISPSDSHLAIECLILLMKELNYTSEYAGKVN